VEKKLNEFINSITTFNALSNANKFLCFIYFHTEVLKKHQTTAKIVKDFYNLIGLPAPQNFGGEIKKLRSKRKTLLIMTPSGGYKPSMDGKKLVLFLIKERLSTKRVKTTLRQLALKIPDQSESAFINEAINCLSIFANRATIVMSWILCLHHLRIYILNHKLNEFNQVLAAQRGIRISSITNYDDFSEFREEKFIELCRTANIITNDQRKILDVNLGIRNTAAHPNSTAISQSKVEAFIEDIIENILFKFLL